MNQQNEKHRQMKINEQQQQQQNEQKWTKISGGSPKQVPSLGVFDDYLWLFMIINNYKMIIYDYFMIIYDYLLL